jgi:hypothetical protein
VTNITLGVNSMNKKAKEIQSSDIYTAFKMAEAEHMKPKRWWHPTAFVEKVSQGADTVKKLFIGIKVKF